MPRITFEATETKTFEPLPAGRYSVRVDDVKWESSKTSGNQQMRMVMTVTQGAQEGRSLNDWITLTEKTGWKFEQVLKAFLADDEYEAVETGKSTDAGRPVLSFDFDSDDLIGVDGIVQVTIEDDQKGTPRNRIRYVALPPQAAAAQAANEEADPADFDDEPAPAPVAKAPAKRRRRRMEA